MSDEKSDQQPTSQESSVEDESQQPTQDEAAEQPQAEADSEFIKQAEAELAQTKSAWSDIDGVISYDADDQSQTQKVITQPTNDRSPPGLNQTNNPAKDAEAAVTSPDTDAIHNTAVDEIIDPHPTQQQQISGVTNGARVVAVVRALVKIIIAAAVVAAGWYAYRKYL